MSTNVHVFPYFDFEPLDVLLLSDIHFDNPKCNRELLKSHLDMALENNMPILVNGDTICGMTWRQDLRGSKGQVRKEYLRDDHWNSICESVIDFFSPYAHLILMIGMGNHEQKLIDVLEIDLLKFVVDGLNRNENANVQLGGYGGWCVFRFQRQNGQGRVNFRIKYYHGSGGGGSSTRGVPQFMSMKSMIEGADLIWMGHIHESYEVVYSVERISPQNKIYLKDVTMVRTSTYKEEYNNGKSGWHVQTGKPPKTLGGRILTLKPERFKVNGSEEIRVLCKTQKII